jgi:hypothetical protein
VLRNPRFLERVVLSRAVECDAEYQDMEFKRSETINIPIMASVQQASPADIRKLPEGERIIEAKMLYSVSEIRASDDTKMIIADIVVDLQGHNWKVQSVDHWQNFGYYAAMITRN